MRFGFWKILPLFLLTGISFVLPADAAYAAESFRLAPKNAISLSDQIIKFHYSADAGETISDTLHINRKYLYGQEPSLDVNYYAVDGHMTSDGFISMESEFENQKYVGAWTTLGAKSEKIEYESDIPFTIKIPKNATPGQYIGGFVLTQKEDETLATPSAPNNLTKVRLRYATSIRIDVKGEFDTSFEISNIGYKPDDGRLKLSFDFINTGNVIHEFTGTYFLNGFFKNDSVSIPLKKVMPGETVHFEENYDRIWKFWGGLDISFSLKSEINFADHSETKEFTDKRHVNHLPATLVFVLLFTFFAICGIILRLIKKGQKNAPKKIKNRKQMGKT